MYKETINIIRKVTDEFQKLINLNPKYIIRSDMRFKKGDICTNLTNRINNQIKNPWIDKKELEKIYNEQFFISKTNTNKKFYYNESKEIKIYASVVSEGFYMDDNYNMYIKLKLNQKGYSGKYNPFITVKINLLTPITLLKLENISKSTIQIKIDLQEEHHEKDISRVNLY